MNKQNAWILTLLLVVVAIAAMYGAGLLATIIPEPEIVEADIVEVLDLRYVGVCPILKFGSGCPQGYDIGITLPTDYNRAEVYRLGETPMYVGDDLTGVVDANGTKHYFTTMNYAEATSFGSLVGSGFAGDRIEPPEPLTCCYGGWHQIGKFCRGSSTLPVEGVYITYGFRQPLDLFIEVNDSFVSRQVLEIPITITYIDSSYVGPIRIDGVIYDGDTPISDTINFLDENGETILVFDATGSGNFGLELEFNHPDTGYRTSYNKSIYVVQEVDIVLTSSPMMYLDVPVVATIQTQMNGVPINVMALSVNAKINNNPVSSQVTKIATGEYNVEIIDPYEGSLLMSVTTDTGSKSLSATIQRPFIKTENNIPIVAATGVTINTVISTYSPSNAKINVDDMLVDITLPSGKVESMSLQKVGEGTYSGTFTFERDGIYYFKLLPSKVLYDTRATTITTTVFGESGEGFPTIYLLGLGAIILIIVMGVKLWRKNR